MGIDAIEPFIKLASSQGKGLFALVRTSNPGSDAVQSLKLADGRSLCDAVAEMISDAGSAAGMIGSNGYSLLGAVVGATKRQDIARLRRIMAKQIFLVPGFGAQGGGDVRACFNDDGAGAIVSASRSVLYAYEKTDGDWLNAVERAAADLNQQIRGVLA
jgi:orotidine-5'-phosphate decarboxylase